MYNIITLKPSDENNSEKLVMYRFYKLFIEYPCFSHLNSLFSPSPASFVLAA